MTRLLAFLAVISCVLLGVLFHFVSIGSKHAELYGKYTWKIEKYSENNRRELRSDVFDVGGYKWYIKFALLPYI